ncbi:hypothetical protein FTW19_05855 [Terriglobus albidus]|uniref:DoxX family protein n=1 Tax=Terriglobus albidus TaxID=1592106 RepID=A0A5B9E751_9BACT|nr:hypothetical protein [Terriglobus albidus]QEE27569.1 hypothetical protein FTW19_05855 [Terriglobus albidus]
MIATRFLRFILAVSAITMLVQAAFAGRMLAGDVKSAVLHAFTAKVLVLLGGSQVLAALALFLQKRCPLWVPVAALGLVSAEVVEFAAGHLHHVAIHVPLGLAIFGGAIRQLLWAIGGIVPAK